MTLKARSKRSEIALTIVLISLLTITLIATACSLHSNIRTNNQTIIQNAPKPLSLSVNATPINETTISNTTNPTYNQSLISLNAEPTPSGTLNVTTYNQLHLTQFFDSLFNQDQDSFSTPAPDPISLNVTDFTTCTYGGYDVQQSNSSQFLFTFPDNTRDGQIAGSDALTRSNFSLQSLAFDAAFVAPKTNALGFDEMAIFATSDTTIYKGTEFGIRIDLNDSYIYGYIQEPTGDGNPEDVNFNMLRLMLNDGIMHHYNVIMSGATVSFFIDGINYGNLSFPSNSDYSNLNFSICAAVHRFTDGWDSEGDSMTAGNFSFNQQ
jgi:hypothetical protein